MTKDCVRCSTTKPITEFNVRKSNKDGRDVRCRPCYNIYQKERRVGQRGPEFPKPNPDCPRCDVRPKRSSGSYCSKCDQAARHGITIEDVEKFLMSQIYLCPICVTGLEFTDDYDIDHDHRCCDKGSSSCGKCVRGILHRPCNKSLGNFKDDPATLRRAADYIERFMEK